MRPYGSARDEVNRANALRSTGPKTEEGKQRSSLNALRHGLTGQIVVMPSEDLEAYQNHLKSFTDEYKPEGATEQNLVQALADASWRLNRVAALETNLLTLGMAKEVEILTNPDQPVDQAFATAGALERQSKALANLSIHSQRLSRQYERTVVQLRALQKERRSHQDHDLNRLLNILYMKESKGEPYDPAADGFVFTPQQIKTGFRDRNLAHLASQARDYRAA
jgi:hypothetical protein